VINHKTVQRLMGEMQLKSRVRAKKYRAYRGEEGMAAPNLMKRDFKAQQPNQKWVTDVTEFKVGAEKLYLSPVIDLYNGEVVAYQIAKRPAFELVTKMLEKAFCRLQSDESPMLHSDQGWQYRMSAYRHLLEQKKVSQSMSRKGNCLDNAVVESFFGTLKSELFHLERFDSVEHLQMAIDDYIHYYNHDRIRLKLGSVRKMMPQTPHGASQSDHRGITFCKLVEARHDAATFLQPSKYTLNDVPLPVFWLVK
jgi:transposase InsO family protein